MREPRRLLERVAKRLKPGGCIVLHEYFDYRTWRVSPALRPVRGDGERHHRRWRESGGEPDIGLDLPRWLVELGFELRSLAPVVHVVPPSSFVWQWPKSFIATGVARLVQLGAFHAGARARDSGGVRRVRGRAEHAHDHAVRARDHRRPPLMTFDHDTLTLLDEALRSLERGFDHPAGRAAAARSRGGTRRNPRRRGANARQLSLLSIRSTPGRC
jgi:hypothetical protein